MKNSNQKIQKIIKLSLLLTLTLTWSCQTVFRKPASEQTQTQPQPNTAPKEATYVQEVADEQLGFLHQNFDLTLKILKEAKKSNKIYNVLNNHDFMNKEIIPVQSEIAKKENARFDSDKKMFNDAVPREIKTQFTKDWRKKRDYLTFEMIDVPNQSENQSNNGNPKKYFKSKVNPFKWRNDKHPQFIMNDINTQVYSIEFTNLITPKNESSVAKISCDGGFHLTGSKFRTNDFSRKKSRNETLTFSLFSNVDGGNAEKIKLFTEKDVTTCTLQVLDLSGSPDWGVELISDRNMTNKNPLWDKFAHLNTEIQGCVLPTTNILNGPEELFLTPDFSSLTCPMALEDSQLLPLPDIVNGIKEKIELLSGGQSLSDKLLKDHNLFDSPFFDPDKIPKFDSIYISYLVFRADFYGTALAQLLEAHAQKGTRIRVLISSAIDKEKDLLMLKRIALKYPNFQYFNYGFHAAEDEKSFFSFVNKLHRVNHVKLFITLSQNNPHLNQVIIGGRNIHDGFAFTSPTDHTVTPQMKDLMINYLEKNQAETKPDDSWASWRDFEAKYSNSEFVKSVTAHFLTLWNHDTRDILINSYNVNLTSSQNATQDYFKNNSDKHLVRHLISVPYRDNQSLHTLFVQLFKSAKKSITLSSPYFRPTEEMVQALKTATDDKVNIDITTRLRLDGDTAAFILEESNKQGVNAVVDLPGVTVHEYNEKDVILHTKIFVIDHKLVFMGSVNLNKRSFYHDLENGVLIYSPSFAKYVEDDLLRSYKENHSNKIAQKIKVEIIPNSILHFLDSLF